MLTIENLARELRSLPTLIWLGVVLLLGGGVADVVAHLWAAGADHEHGFTPSEFSAHVVVVVGMVIVLLGVVVHGVRHSAPTTRSGDSMKGGI